MRRIDGQVALRQPVERLGHVDQRLHEDAPGGHDDQPSHQDADQDQHTHQDLRGQAGRPGRSGLRLGAGFDPARGLLHRAFERGELLQEGRHGGIGRGWIAPGQPDDLLGAGNILAEWRLDGRQGGVRRRVRGQGLVALDVVPECPGVLVQVRLDSPEGHAGRRIRGAQRHQDVGAQGVMHHVGVHMQAHDLVRSHGARQAPLRCVAAHNPAAEVAEARIRMIAPAAATLPLMESSFMPCPNFA